ncbi:MAG: polyprenyl synthetase family protein [Phycisphaerales bacterium]|nr:polyprenyl synthetase family protein [Phycisphaerales bacterium]
MDHATHAALLEHIEASLAATIEHADLAPQLRDACRHALLGGGKRLRPLLVMESARAAGGSTESALAAATAIELVHAFSLVHDDLPALDNDLVRRGLPTVHAKYGEALAILAGDALLTLAFVAASSSDHAPKIVSELSRATTRMINGQCFDTLGGFPTNTNTAAQLELIHRNKTGALIECACVMGGMTAGVSEELLAALRNFGASLGLMFQVVDDIIDETQSSEHAGKATGKDREAGKLTYPVVHGLAQSRAEVARLEGEANAAIARIRGLQRASAASTAGIESLLNRCVSRTK